MARIFITGSSDGVGLLAARRLVAGGHKVILHARNAQRARDAEAACPGAEAVLIGDLSSIDGTKTLAADANKLVGESGRFDTVIHNAGVYREGASATAPSGFSQLFTVNTLAPYILTVALNRPRRLVFISSGLHNGGQPKLDTLPQNVNYNDSKLHNVILAKAFARRWGGKSDGFVANAANPGWVPTKMGGPSATDSLDVAVDTYVTTALGQGAAKCQTGQYFDRSRPARSNPIADDVAVQDQLLRKLAELSGVPLFG